MLLNRWLYCIGSSFERNKMILGRFVLKVSLTVCQANNSREKILSSIHWLCSFSVLFPKKKLTTTLTRIVCLLIFERTKPAAQTKIECYFNLNGYDILSNECAIRHMSMKRLNTLKLISFLSLDVCSTKCFVRSHKFIAFQSVKTAVRTREKAK